ncbi:Methyltransferase type 12, partial [mine drainage metagenome]
MRRLPILRAGQPLIFDDGGTYVDTDATFTANRTHEWSHGLGETVSALLDAGLQLTN